MDQMMKLDTSQLNMLRNEFDQHQGGLSLEQFVSVMSKALPRSRQDAERLSIETVQSLRELFLQVDVNGDGTMEWDEFTGFCIDQGIAATSSHGSSAVPDQLYSERTKWQDKSRTYDSVVTRVDWIPELEKVFVCESHCTSVKVFDPDRGNRGPLLLHQISLENAKSANRHETAGTHKDKVKLTGGKNGEAKTETAVPLCVDYISEYAMLVIAMSDIAVSFWDTTAYRRDPDNAVPWFIKRVHTEKLVLKMSWCAPYNILFTSGPQASGEIYAWKVAIEGHGADLKVRKLGMLRGHTDVVTDLLTVSEMRGNTLDFCALVSSSMDKCLHIWDPETLTLRAKRTGHKMGVRCLSFVGGGQNDGVLCVSGGFDNEVLLWETRGVADKPLLRLKGHTAPIVHARMHSPGRIVTVDESCTIKWWHMGSDFSSTSNYECIQTVLAYTGMSKSVPPPVSMVCAGSNHRIMIAAKSLKIFDMVRVRPKTTPAVGILFNHTSKTLASASGRNVTVWSATTGQKEQVFHDCSDIKLAQDAGIAALCLDHRHRKFLTADVAGSISVFNYMNGALMKQNSAVHSKEISAICYADADRCVITASWDRSWKVMDEDSSAEAHSMPVLRSVHKAHDFDISALCFSYMLNLVATGDSNGIIKVWDFQFATYEGTCGNLDGSPITSGGKGLKGDEITCMQFLDPYPLLAIADYAGGIHVYSVRPWYASYRLVRSFDNVITDNFGQQVVWPVTCMKYMFDPSGTEIAPDDGRDAVLADDRLHKMEEKASENGIDSAVKSRVLLYCGDENGNISVYDLMPVISAAGITPVTKKDMPVERNNYNARRRVELYGNGLPSLEAYTSTNQILAETSLARQQDMEESSSGIKSRTTSKTTSELSELSDVSFNSESALSLPAIGKKSIGTLSNRQHEATAGNDGSSTQSLTASRVKRRGSTRSLPGRKKNSDLARLIKTEMKQNARVMKEKDDLSRIPLLEQTTAPRPALLSQWIAHEGSIVTAIDVNLRKEENNMVPCVVTAGEDLVIRAFSVDGVPFGFLTKGDEEDANRRKPYPWTCLLDIEAQATAQKRATIEVRDSVILQEDSEAKTRAKAEKNRLRVLANAEFISAKKSPSNSTLNSPKGSQSTDTFDVSDDIKWQIENAKSGEWETVEQRLVISIEIAYQKYLAEKKIAACAVAQAAQAEAVARAEAEAEQAARDEEARKRGEKVFKRRKATKKPKEDSNDGDRAINSKDGEPHGIVINVRGKRLMFYPENMTITWIGGVDCEPKSIQRIDATAAEFEKRALQELLDKDRVRVVGQLLGKKTWKLSDLERGRMLAEKEEEERRRAKKAATKKSKTSEEKEDDEMQELLADPVIERGKAKDDNPDRLPFDHPGNWAMGSVNRLKMLYPNWNGEHNRTEAKKEKTANKQGKAGMPSANEDAVLSESRKRNSFDEEEQWLQSRLSLHSHLVEQLDNKKKQQKEAAAQAKSRLRKILDDQKKAANEKRKKHRKRMRADPGYAAKINAMKKPGVPSHLVRTLDLSKSAPTLVPEVRRPARHIRRTLKESGAIPEAIKNVSSLKNRLKFVMRDLEKDVAQALSPKKQKEIGGKKRGRSRGRSRGGMRDRDGEETEEDRQVRLEEEELKAQRRKERKAALRRKLHFGTYNKEQLLHMRAKFKKMDKDGSGHIDLDEFLISEDDSHMSDHMASMFHAMDKDGDGNVTLKEMCSVVFYKAPPRELRDIVEFLSLKKTPRLQSEEKKLPTQEEIEELRAIFDMYDEDGSGVLDRMEIYKALGVVSGFSAQTGLSLEELDAMIDEADVDGSDEIDKEEFVAMMSHVSTGIATFDPW